MHSSSVLYVSFNKNLSTTSTKTETMIGNQRHGQVVNSVRFGSWQTGFYLSRIKPKTLKLVSAVALAKRSAIKCSAEDEINRE